MSKNEEWIEIEDTLSEMLKEFKLEGTDEVAYDWNELRKRVFYKDGMSQRPGEFDEPMPYIPVFTLEEFATLKALLESLTARHRKLAGLKNLDKDYDIMGLKEVMWAWEEVLMDMVRKGRLEIRQ